LFAGKMRLSAHLDFNSQDDVYDAVIMVLGSFEKCNTSAGQLLTFGASQSA